MPVSDPIAELGHRLACPEQASKGPEIRRSSASPDFTANGWPLAVSQITDDAVSASPSGHRQDSDTPFVGSCRLTDTTAPRDLAPVVPPVPSLAGVGPGALPSLPDGFEWVDTTGHGLAYDLRPTGRGITLLCLHTGVIGDEPGTWRMDPYGYRGLRFQGAFDEAVQAALTALPPCLARYRASLRGGR